MEKRGHKGEELNRIINETLLTRRAEEWEGIFREVEVPVGVVNNLERAINHPQIRHREMTVPIKQSHGDEWTFAANPVKIKGSKEVYDAAGPVGSNTIEVLSGVLDYSDATIDELRKKNAVWDASWDGN